MKNKLYIFIIFFFSCSFCFSQEKRSFITKYPYNENDTMISLLVFIDDEIFLDIVSPQIQIENKTTKHIDIIPSTYIPGILILPKKVTEYNDSIYQVNFCFTDILGLFYKDYCVSLQSLSFSSIGHVVGDSAFFSYGYSIFYIYNKNKLQNRLRFTSFNNKDYIYRYEISQFFSVLERRHFLRKKDIKQKMKTTSKCYFGFY